ncbi:hypothetical protein EJM73_06280 [Clostridium botulinum]|uniref:Uncharacterized protein n=1 Tax=Clostridium botulinum (strain 657 / Type Ba4) TaxID=515621 RepID=A0A3F2ZU83_CLOB6|nr:hypothetical protein [Clostridium botulinum]ACQ51405.1 hypothetical protein CLJ_0283 [Clostridium botulinum Ba4 str. 657]APR02776.1 hypothetical protein RSJ2_3756 [Clostridium botulinum]AUN19829.1 hypothetical protein B2M06_20005 [Clostridium botulinum]AXG90358.1 hypothetical protein AGE29_00660 [Clostridium botulinum]EPS54496.1 hypothetical protein CLQ_14453 [Clostridium botulinum Af84]
MAKTLRRKNKKERDEVSIESIAKLALLPGTIDSIKDFQNNIKAYGYLENILGICNNIKKEDTYIKIYNKIESNIIKKDVEGLMYFHNKIISFTKSKEDKTLVNILFMCIMHECNKNLGLYNL